VLFEDEDPQVLFLIKRWHNGDSIMPAVRRLMELGDMDRAGATARLALVYPDCKEREELHEVLREISSVPAGWAESIAAYCEEPTEERWEAMLRFVPLDNLYNTVRTLLPELMRRGCDGDLLFTHASRVGKTPDLFTLAESGTVSPETIERRGDGSPARGTWLGLAAQAAFARGDRFATVRYLREACRDEEQAQFAWGSIFDIREQADDDLNAQLDKVGVPRL
jgi:hypothetical protein